MREAVRTLAELQALEGPTHELTPLGHHLATLPVDVRIGKMMILGGGPNRNGDRRGERFDRGHARFKCEPSHERFG